MESLLKGFDDQLARGQREKDNAGIAAAVRGVVEGVMGVYRGGGPGVNGVLEAHAPTFYGSFPFLCDKLVQGVGPQDLALIDFMLARMSSPSGDDQEVVDRVSELTGGEPRG